MEIKVKWIIIFLFLITFFTFWFSFHFEMWSTEDLGPEYDDESEAFFSDSADVFDSLQADVLEEVYPTSTDSWLDNFGTTQTIQDSGYQTDDSQSSTQDSADIEAWWNRFLDESRQELGTMETTSFGFNWWDSTSTVTQMSFNARDDLAWLKEVHGSLLDKKFTGSTKNPYDFESTTTDWDFDWTTSESTTESTTEFMKATPSPLQGDGVAFINSGIDNGLPDVPLPAQKVDEESSAISSVDDSEAERTDTITATEKSVPHVMDTQEYDQNGDANSRIASVDIKPYVPGSDTPTYVNSVTQYNQMLPNEMEKSEMGSGPSGYQMNANAQGSLASYGLSGQVTNSVLSNQVSISNTYNKNANSLNNYQINGINTNNDTGAISNQGMDNFNNKANNALPPHSSNLSPGINIPTHIQNETIIDRGNTNGEDIRTVPIQQTVSNSYTQETGDSVLEQNTNNEVLSQNTDSDYLDKSTKSDYLGQDTSSGYLGQTTNNGYPEQETENGILKQVPIEKTFNQETNSGGLDQISYTDSGI